MNINEVNGNDHPKQLRAGRKVECEKKFEDIFKDAVDNIVKENRAADEVPPAKGVALPSSWDRGHVDHLLFQRAVSILDLLEEYSEGLKDPCMTLKKIEPIVTRIDNELKDLDLQSIEALGQNHELVSIMNDIAVTASVEAFKFQRGDYIA